jgi:hypothetical protein
MTIFLPISAIEGIKRAQLDADQVHADSLVDQLLSAVSSQVPLMVEVANQAGALKMTAAVFLLRACELLAEVR